MVYIHSQGLGLTADSQVLFVPNTNRAGNQIYCDLLKIFTGLFLNTCLFNGPTTKLIE